MRWPRSASATYRWTTQATLVQLAVARGPSLTRFAWLSNGAACVTIGLKAGPRRFISFHVLVPGEWTVQRGHDLLELIEQDIRAALPLTTLFTHLEPLEDPRAFEDIGLDRPVNLGGIETDSTVAD